MQYAYFTIAINNETLNFNPSAKQLNKCLSYRIGLLGQQACSLPPLYAQN